MNDYIIASCTDTGKVRKVNEDSMATFDSPNGTVVVVSDGMGGQNAGDVASQLAVAVIRDILTDNTFTTPIEAIVKSVMAANQAILHKAAQNPDLEGMGATCVILIIRDGKVYYGSVGDSRIYYVAAGMIRQLTKDQSYVQTLVDAGELTEEAAEHHRDKNQITNALGLEGMTPPVVGQMPISPEPGSVFVLCSDGLSGMINNNTILNTVSRNDLSLQERAQMLVKQANDAGGNDNITVQLVEFPMQSAVMAAPIRTATEAGSTVAPVLSNKDGKKNKTTLWIILAIVALMIIGAAIWWCVYKPEPKPTPTPTVNVKKTPETKSVPQKKVEKSKQETTKVIVVEEAPKEKSKGSPTKKKGSSEKIREKAQQSSPLDQIKEDQKIETPIEVDNRKDNTGSFEDEKGVK